MREKQKCRRLHTDLCTSYCCRPSWRSSSACSWSSPPSTRRTRRSSGCSPGSATWSRRRSLEDSSSSGFYSQRPPERAKCLSARLQETRLKWSQRGELPPSAARWGEQLLPERSAGGSSVEDRTSAEASWLLTDQQQNGRSFRESSEWSCCRVAF